MLTHLTQTAIAVLHDIALKGCLSSADFSIGEDKLNELLQKLEASLIIHRLPEQEKDTQPSYELYRPLNEISILNVIEAVGEPVNCKCPTSEAFYITHSRVAQKIGVINQVVRTYLSEIKISDW